MLQHLTTQLLTKKTAVKISTNVQGIISQVFGLEVVPCRGTITICQVNLWMVYEADKGGGTVPPAGMPAAITNKPVRRKYYTALASSATTYVTGFDSSHSCFCLKTVIVTMV